MPGEEDSPRIDRFTNAIGAIFTEGGNRFTVDASALDPDQTPEANNTVTVGPAAGPNRTVGTAGQTGEVSFTLDQPRAFVEVGGRDIARVYERQTDDATAPDNQPTESTDLTPSGEPAEDDIQLGSTGPGPGATSTGPGPGATSTGPGGALESVDGGVVAVALALLGLAAAILGGYS